MADLSPDELLAIHKSYADTFAALAQSGLVQAYSQLSDSDLFDYRPAQIIITAPQFGTPNRDIILPDEPPSPVIAPLGYLDSPVPVPNADFGEAPVSTLGNAPKYVAPVKPSAIPSFTEGKPSISTTIIMPEVPPYLPMPGLALPYPTINVPTKPPLTMPVFEGRRPDDIAPVDPDVIVNAYKTEQVNHRNLLPAFTIGVADSMLAKYAPEYTALRTAINTAVVDYLNPTTGGGAGIPANIETAIAARNSDRNNLEFQRALSTASETLSKQGFSIPPGAMLATLRQARTAMGDAQVRGNVEIATNNFELEQKNMQFMVKLGEELEVKILETITQYLQLALRMDELSIQSAKEIIAAYLGAYNVQVLVYRALWEGYAADAEVFKARIQALDSQVRLYEAEIRAEMAKVEVNKAHVDVLKAVADVNQALADSYKAQVEAAVAPLEVARIQLAIWEAQIRAFVAQVGVYEAQWNGYRAEVEGALGAIRGYEAQANAYTAQVNGYKAQVEAYGAKVAAVGEANRAVLGKNEGTIKVFATKADVAVSTYRGLVEAYSVQANAATKQAEIEIEYWRTAANLVMQEYTTTMNQTFEFAREQMNLFRGQMEAAISAGNGLAQASAVAGNLAGGAMAGLTSFAGRLVNSDA